MVAFTRCISIFSVPLLLLVNGGCQPEFEMSDKSENGFRHRVVNTSPSTSAKADEAAIKTKDISVVSYNALWPELFKAEKAIIVAALKDDCLCIHHIGSTSVPGLAAKPKIDIIVAANNRERAIEALEKAGYKHKGEWGIPLQCGFSKRKNEANPIDVNLHVFFDINHPEIELNLRFRDYLRENPAVREEYARIKREILENSSSRIVVKNSSDGIFPEYTLRKAPFINEVLRKAGYERLRVLKANTKEHWAAIKKFKEDLIKKGTYKNDNNGDVEYFIFYRGVDIIGCAELALLSLRKASQEQSQKRDRKRAKIVMFAFSDRSTKIKNKSEEKMKRFFEDILRSWCSVHGYVVESGSK